MICLSKSKYCGLWQCPKIEWLKKYRPEELTPCGDVEELMNRGNEIGDLAMDLFGDHVEVTQYDGGKIDIPKMISRTREEMEKNTPVICEASFSYDGLYCAADILRREAGGWAIYEVKSSTNHDKQVYYADVAYQKYVLERCGVNVTGVYIVCLNGDYVFDGELKLGELFRIIRVDDKITDEEKNVEACINSARAMLEDDAEPSVPLSARCFSPYGCAFWAYCTRDLPSPSVFDLYLLSQKKKFAFWEEGRFSFESLEGERLLSEKQLRQIDFELHDRGTYVDREKIKEFLGGLSYPIYFLDFETLMPAVPIYPGTKPYTQIPFQYSLHYIEREGGEILHKEFLGEPEEDPRRALAERLCEDIPANVCVTAYNKSFECSRIKALAAIFPDLSERLKNISDNIADLYVPFRSGWYYKREMGGSFSIKSVLPAIFPDDPALDYHNLEGIHNGTEAMNAYPAMAKMDPQERAAVRRDLLKYCELDTYALVKVWEELKRAAEDPGV